MKNQNTNWWVYIAQCDDGSLYTGISNDIPKRIQKHNSGKGATYTKLRGPVELVYSEPHTDRSSATKREFAIKQLTRQQKLELINH
jgi:putative endonuclease